MGSIDDKNSAGQTCGGGDGCGVDDCGDNVSATDVRIGECESSDSEDDEAGIDEVEFNEDFNYQGATWGCGPTLEESTQSSNTATGTRRPPSKAHLERREREEGRVTLQCAKTKVIHKRMRTWATSGAREDGGYLTPSCFYCAERSVLVCYGCAPDGLYLCQDCDNAHDSWSLHNRCMLNLETLGFSPLPQENRRLRHHHCPSCLHSLHLGENDVDATCSIIGESQVTLHTTEV